MARSVIAWALAAALAAFTTVFAQTAGPLATVPEGMKAVTLAGGCFWCVESDFDHVPGVVETISGYTGGTADNPTYSQVSAGGTGHYEAVRIVYDPQKVTYDQLLDVFWRSVDPTDAGGQFCDRGESYRTAVFVATPEERQAAEASKAEAEKALGRPIVTPILDAGAFWPAEGYHQNYYVENPLRYNYYRWGCGRDARLTELWGDQAMAGIVKE
jgi:peptide-methionine (S)-S-oxide reductase